MIARRPEKPDRPVQDRVPANILKRPLRLTPMRKIKNQAGEEGMDRLACSCKRPNDYRARRRSDQLRPLPRLGRGGREVSARPSIRRSRSLSSWA